MGRKNWPRVLKVFLLLAAASVGSFSRDASAENPWGAKFFPNLELTTQNGVKVHLYDDLLKGKIVAIELIYTHCEFSCPLETARLVQVQKMLGDRVGKDIFFYSISIDPEHDTPAELKAYAAKFNTGPGWTFLTGKKADIDLLSGKIGLYSDPSETKDRHVPYLLIGNEVTGQWLRNSAMENPRFLANMIGNFLDNWKHADSGASGQSSSEVPHMTFDQGKYLYSRECAPCHSIGHGDRIGPDLQGITKLRDRKWIIRMIQEPDKVLAENNATAAALLKKYNNVRMPNLRVSVEDTNFLIRFLESRSVPRDEKILSPSAPGANGD